MLNPEEGIRRSTGARIPLRIQLIASRDVEFLLGGVTAFSPQAQRAAACAIIEQEIGKYEEMIRVATEKICSWKSRRNSLCNIARLPSEILSKIFLLVIMSHARTNYEISPVINPMMIDTNFYDEETCLYRPQWVTIGHVCKEWYQLMLDSPSIWCRPYFGLSNASSEMLSRAKDAPIDTELVYWNCPSEENIAEEELAFQNLYRTRTLEIFTPRYPHFTDSSREFGNGQCLKRPAPLLQALTIWSERKSLANFLPWNLFSGEHPLLQELTLINWHLRLEEAYIKPLSNLTVLTVVQDPSSPRREPTLRFRPSKFLSALRWLPKLSKLVLKYSLFNPNEEDFFQLEGSTHLEMQRLRLIGFTETLKATLFVLDHLAMPTLASSMIEIDPASSAPDSSTSTSHPIRDLVETFTGKSDTFSDPLVGMSLERWPGWSASAYVELTTRKQNQSSPNSGYRPKPQLNALYPGYSGFPDLSSICSLPCISDLEIISINTPIDRDAWINLSQSRSLSRVTLGMAVGNLDIFFDTLVSPSSSAFIPFSNLDVLGLHYVNFTERLGTINPIQIHFHRLCQCIEARRQRNLGPSNLILKGCRNVPEELLFPLNSYIQVENIV